MVIHTAPEAARITTIDVGRPARALALLRLSDMFLVLGCGSAAVGSLSDITLALSRAQWTELLVNGTVSATLGFAAYTGWRHLGVIDPRVWRSYRWLLPLLTGLAAFLGLAIVVEWRAHGVNPFDDAQSFMGVTATLTFVAISVPGFICVLLLRRTRIAPLGVRLQDLLHDLWSRGGTSGLRIANHRINTRRGVAFGVVGALILAGAIFAPLPTKSQQASIALRVIQQLNVLGCFLLLRARRYFQVSADSLLQVDKRPPILFLRSFSDDERRSYTQAQGALLDYSLETRLANHFYRFGPFIAVGSPKDTIPQVGAARALLREDEWQVRVLDWMRDASVIIMYGGTTQWVNWELRRVVKTGAATRLILLFPEIKKWRVSRRRADTDLRVKQAREAFEGTPWSAHLAAFEDSKRLRAMLFRPDGSVLAIRSSARNRDAYHLAVLIAHEELVHPGGIPEEMRYREPKPLLRRALATVGVLVCVALAGLGGVYYLSRPGDGRLTFLRSDLYYGGGASADEARAVGEYLVKQGLFASETGADVQLHRSKGGYQLRFVINPDHADDLVVALEFGVLGDQIAREVLGGKPTEVGFSDRQLHLLKVIPPTAKIAFWSSDLYYTAPVSAAEARAIGEVLKKRGLFAEETAASVQVGREGGVYQLRFVVNPSAAVDPESTEFFRGLARLVAAEALGGRPVLLHLCDDHFKTLRQERL